MSTAQRTAGGCTVAAQLKAAYQGWRWLAAEARQKDARRTAKSTIKPDINCVRARLRKVGMLCLDVRCSKPNDLAPLAVHYAITAAAATEAENTLTQLELAR